MEKRTKVHQGSTPYVFTSCRPITERVLQLSPSIAFQEKCELDRDKDGVFFVRCSNSSGQKGKNKNRKAESGENKKRQVSGQT